MTLVAAALVPLDSVFRRVRKSRCRVGKGANHSDPLAGERRRGLAFNPIGRPSTLSGGDLRDRDTNAASNAEIVLVAAKDDGAAEFPVLLVAPIEVFDIGSGKPVLLDIEDI